MLPPPPSVAGVDLARLWIETRALLDRADDKALGRVRVGETDRDEKPWAQTNDGEDRVNLTLELKPDQFEINIVGWKEEQSEALKVWLQSVAGENEINALDGYEVVAFSRRAYKKTASSKPWWQEETVKVLGTCPAAKFTAGWVVGHMLGLGSRKEEKPAFHVRRAWPRPEADALGRELPAALSAEVKRLLPLLRDIWSQEKREPLG
jgi:hypothetical protein